MNLFKNLFKGDKVIWIIFLLLCLISVIEVFSAASTLTYKSGDHWSPIIRHCAFLLVGTLGVIFFHNIHYKWFQVLPLFLLPISAVFLIMLLMFDHLNIGGVFVIEKVNEASRWIQIAGVQFQPSEFAKMGVIIVTASILSQKREEWIGANAFNIILWIAGICCALILPENYSTAILLFGVVYVMMFIGCIPAKKMLKLGAFLFAVAAVFVTFLLVTPEPALGKLPVIGNRCVTWKHRIEGFTDHKEVPPEKFDVDKEAQVGHARIAVASSHIIGVGPGNSIQRDYLPQAFSDFIYVIIIEEFGLIGGIFVVFLYICLLIRVGRIAQKCDRTVPAFLIIGIAVLLVVQALFNMMVAVGLAPVTGQPLPLISRGGTSTIVNCLYIGMILSVSRYTARLEELRAHDAQIPMQIETGRGDLDVQLVAEPISETLNSDEKFE